MVDTKIKDLLKKVRAIEIKTKRLSNQVFSGAYHSMFKGRGMTFSEVREYTVGDDVRSIDWNVTARLSTPHIKVFEEERELTVMLLVDVSGSSDFGTGDQKKRDMMVEICATLAFSAAQNNDKVGLILFSDRVELFVPPKKKKSHILRILRDMIECKPQRHHTNISVALDFMMGVQKRKAVVFLISDFFDKDYDRSLSIASRRHDITTIRLYDEREREIPNVGMLYTKDLETGDYQHIDTTSRKVRLAYKETFDGYREHHHSVLSKIPSGSIEMSLEDSYIKKLWSYFKTGR